MGTDGRGAGCRRTRRSPAGRRGAEEAGALAGEATGGGGRGAHQWWGGARHSRKRCSPAREAWGGGDERDVGQCEVGWRGVRWVAWAGRARSRSVSWRAGFGWSVGPLGPGDGALVHHPR
jgi:hypothetical protein